MLIAINQLGFGSIIPVLPLYAQSFGVTASAIGMAVAVYGLARLLVAIPTGRLSDLLGRRPTLAIGGLVSGLGNLWCALAPTFPEFLLARFVAGAGAGLVLTAGSVVLADITIPARRGRVMAIYQGVFLFAVGIGPFPGGLLAEAFGLAAPFAAYAVLGAAAGAVAWLAVPETRGFRSGAHGAPLPERPRLGVQIHLMVSQVGFLLASLVSFMNAFARTGGLFAIVPIIAAVTLGLPPGRIGLGMAIGSIAGLAITYPAGVLVDRYGRKRVIVPATVVSGASLALFCFAPTYAWFVAACVGWGVASAAGGAAPAAYAADLAPPGMNATAISMFRMLGDIGYVVGPIALGAAVDLFGPQRSLLASALALVAVGLLFARYAPETYRGIR